LDWQMLYEHIRSHGNLAEMGTALFDEPISASLRVANASTVVTDGVSFGIYAAREWFPMLPARGCGVQCG
jgi:hypothetical protein